jgi:hypothetical protein
MCDKPGTLQGRACHRLVAVGNQASPRLDFELTAGRWVGEIPRNRAAPARARLFSCEEGGSPTTAIAMGELIGMAVMLSLTHLRGANARVASLADGVAETIVYADLRIDGRTSTCRRISMGRRNSRPSSAPT